jgi:hypothetical protein
LVELSERVEPLCDSCFRLRTAVRWLRTLPEPAARVPCCDSGFVRGRLRSVQLSAVAFSADRGSAVVRAVADCGYLCGFGGLYVLNREGDRWRIVAQPATEAR